LLHVSNRKKQQLSGNFRIFIYSNLRASLSMNNSFIKCLLIIYLCTVACAVTAQPAKVHVFVMEIRDQIDPRMTRYVNLALEEATKTKADYLLIDMDTYGGTLNDADVIRSKLLNFPKPVMVFINPNAASAGALISIACDSIYMSNGASIGAATVVNGAGGEAAPDKYQSYMRSLMRSTAETNNRNPRIAEAMVDQTIQLDSIKQEGKVITLTTTEAIRYGFCEGRANSVEEILKMNNITGYRVSRYELSAIEKIIALFLNPFISGLLILAIIGGIYFELQSPGIGFPLLIAIIAAVLYFVPYYLNGLAANWEIIVFFIGIVLLAVEMFVLPGFGIAGVAGLVCIFGSLILIMVDNDWFDFSRIPAYSMRDSLTAVGIGMMGAILTIIFGGAKFVKSERFKKMTLQHKLDKDQGYTSNFLVKPMIGRTGEAYTVLRPSGKVLIDDTIYDAFTRGDYIDKGATIVVVDQEGSSVKVRKVQE
jgi:membrane-bound serine protease (ClpP class)